MTLKENIAYTKEFGLSLTFWKTLNSISQALSKGKLSWRIHDKNNDKIESYISKVCHSIINSASSDSYSENQTYLTSKKREDIPKNEIIWMMWWQGEKNAPPLVKECINSARKNSNGHQVIVIDQDNYSDFVTVPDFILKKYEEGKKDNSPLKDCVLTTTHFSDIIRTLLLYQYGGIWADATIFFTDKIPEKYFQQELTTLGEDNEWFIGRGKWSIWFIGCHSGNLLMKFIYQMLVEYRKTVKYNVNYLFFYHIMDIAYKNIPNLKKILDIETNSNKKALFINRNYNKPVKVEEMEKILSKQHIYKLSWKWWGNTANAPLYITTNDGKLTYFGYLYKKYIEK